ncbi:MAG: hypothetical protein KDG53_18975, partial [Rhodocyclaceae bacterium]|nr:hypothetical protein [Rhodocyclaceae bacterium]
VDYSAMGDAVYLLAGVLATLLTLAVAWVYSHLRGHPRALQGIFVQASFRSNLAIIGIALAVSAYGEQGLVLAAMPVALLSVSPWRCRPTASRGWYWQPCRSRC